MERLEKISILYVDDEINNLNSFKAAFRRDFNVLLAVLVSSTFSIVFYAIKGIKPSLGNFRAPLFKRRLS